MKEGTHMAVLDRAVIVAGRRILAGDQRVLINNLVVFEKNSKGRWHFDPSGWLLAGEVGVLPKELWHILIHPPFSFPLESCWANKKCSEDKCCQFPPGLTEKEFASFLEAGYDWEFFDFETYIVRPKKEDGYCIFYNGGGCALFGDRLRPQQCRWRYCWDYPPAPSDRVRQLYNLK